MRSRRLATVRQRHEDYQSERRRPSGGAGGDSVRGYAARADIRLRRRRIRRWRVGRDWGRRSSSGVFPPSMLDTAIKPGFLHESGVMLGAGGVIAIDDSLSPLDVVRNLAWYNANESCGKCTPCREGTPRMARMLDAMANGEASASDVAELESLARLVNAASLCGLGTGGGQPGA